MAGMVPVMDSGDLEARISALETEVRELNVRVRRSEEDSAAARVLAGAADRDVSEMHGELRTLRNRADETSSDLRAFRQATAASFNAMRQDYVDLRRHFDEQFAKVEEQFAKVDDGFTEMRGKFDATAAGLQEIAGMLHTIMTDRGPNGSTT